MIILPDATRSSRATDRASNLAGTIRSPKATSRDFLFILEEIKTIPRETSFFKCDRFFPR